MNTTYEKQFISNSDLLPEIEQYVLGIVKELKIPESFHNNIELGVAEAAANCILHGNKNDPSKNITIKIFYNSSKLILSFTDEGEGFTPDEVPDPTKPENILKGSGRGLHIMKSLVDEVKYNFTDSGTELILTLYIA